MKCLCTGYKGLLTNFEEKWKPVVGFEGVYEVSDKGSVKSLDRFVDELRPRLVRGKVLKPYKDAQGYLVVSLYKDSKKHTITIHRLVAKAFVANCESKSTVNHIDSDKENNFAVNLEWATQLEQNNHSFKSRTRRANVYSPELKQSAHDYYVLNNCSVRDLSEHFGISFRTATNIVNGDYNSTACFKLSNEDVENLFKLREVGLTQKQLAEKFNCSRSHISNILRGYCRNVKYERY